MHKYVLATILALTGCGGGGSPAPIAVQDPAPVRNTTYSSVSIYYDGDSTAYGWALTGGTLTCNDGVSSSGCTVNDYGHGIASDTPTQQPDNEPATVQRDMANAFGPVVTVENHGVGGMTVLDSINGTNRYDCATNGNNESYTCGALGDRLRASHAQIVIGKFLTNDQYRMPPQAFQQYIAVWINTVQGLRNADGNPMIAVWEESSPICRLDAPNVGPYLQADRTAATAANAMVVGNHDWVYQDYNWIPALLDCVHPDDALYLAMGHIMSNDLARTVQVLLGR